MNKSLFCDQSIWPIIPLRMLKRLLMIIKSGLSIFSSHFLSQKTSFKLYIKTYNSMINLIQVQSYDLIQKDYLYGRLKYSCSSFFKLDFKQDMFDISFRIVPNVFAKQTSRDKMNNKVY